MSREGVAFWRAFLTGRHQLRFAGTVPVGFDATAILALAGAAGCPSVAAAFFYDAVEPAALSALHEKLRDSND